MLSIKTTGDWQTDRWPKNQLNSLRFLVSNLWKKALNSLPVNHQQLSLFATIIKLSEGVHLKVLHSRYCAESYLLYVVLATQCTQWLRELEKEFAAGVSRYLSGTFVIPPPLTMLLNCKPIFQYKTKCDKFGELFQYNIRLTHELNLGFMTVSNRTGTQNYEINSLPETLNQPIYC